MKKVLVASLVPYEKNTRTHSPDQINKIAASITEFGWTNPVLIDGDNNVIAGHGRILAAKQLGITEVPAIDLSHLTATQRRAYIIADNQLALESGWNEDLLAQELADLKLDGFDLSLIGFADSDLNAILTGLGDFEGLTDPDEVPEAPIIPVSKPGDVWLIGKHKLMNGDCRDFKSVSKLMDGNNINVAITSPPYASQRKYDESSGFKPILADEYIDWYRDVAVNIKANLAEDGSYFLNIKEHCENGQRSLYVKDLTLAHVREWGWMFIDEFCWQRKGVPGSWPNRFKNEWEPVFHFSKWNKIKFKPELVSHASENAFKYDASMPKTPAGFLSGKKNEFGRSKDDICLKGFARPGNHIIAQTGEVSVASIHTATYPVALPEFFIKAFSNELDSIYDPFMGSGTTLIASEKNRRTSYGMELSPAYCDVIINRWQNFTGQQATLKATGQTFDELQEQTQAIPS